MVRQTVKIIKTVDSGNTDAKHVKNNQHAA